MATLPEPSPWLRRAYVRAVEGLERGQLGHATLFAGPARSGKRLLAELLAKRVLCLAPGAAGPCDACRSCRLFESRAQMDPVETRPDGSLAHPWGHSAHPDLVFVGHQWNDKARPPKMRGELVIEQIRALTERLGLTPQLSPCQVVIVDPADAVNYSAFNALLKTLEEPQPNRYLWLLASSVARLPATIRSRCQKLELRMPPRDEALAWLQSLGHPADAASQALDATRGDPGLAHGWLGDGGLALRKQVGDDLARIARDELPVVEAAQAWVADERAELRLRHAADLALAAAARGLTDPVRTRRLAAWFDSANRARDLLRTTVRADLVVVELLLAWRDQARVRGRGDEA